ncbi:RING-H2 finger protein ATL72 [Hibiscus syriacus]|uniref:RING-type E3 ubiquitin transferase n=1 Tax=Hibiscus syriacus TaxID=106335 RepID=A0A6A2Z176_HIBSY|nr:RING-H2 finger protein ATL74-like [Hibiscus syriacus]KAE8685658.1 RING-H2 finger protein ATL72 [Hibiscus syriacus]
MQRRRLLGPEVSPPPLKHGNETRDLHISDTNFDTNMVFILAVFLCALIFALVLNSIARWARGCGRRFAPDTRERPLSVTTGLKKLDLERIPVAVLGSDSNFNSTECSICLGEFEDGEKVRVLPECKHGFHVRCIDTWLVSHSSCPNCRHSLLEHCILENAETSPEDPAGQLSEDGIGEQQLDSGAVVVQEGI